MAGAALPYSVYGTCATKELTSRVTKASEGGASRPWQADAPLLRVRDVRDEGAHVKNHVKRRMCTPCTRPRPAKSAMVDEPP